MQVASAHDRVGREGARAADDADVLAVLGVVPGGHVGDLAAGQQEGAEVAEVLPALGAARAATTARDEAQDDVVARLHGGDPGPDLDHLASALVAADDRELLEADQLGDLGRQDHVAGDEVLVGVAQARGSELDLDLAGLRLVELDVLDAPVVADPVENCCARLHGRSCFPWFDDASAPGPGVLLTAQSSTSGGGILPDQAGRRARTERRRAQPAQTPAP